ncbi:F0F1 ATP synthase subunit epsilon [Mesonia sp. MT50]|uniref:F0F1 ATP synthase subunit epsilon n=1 Tax=Mesonia profundi TaxID=3070998 RepID=A0ABU1A430_9FLAO|nr:F0F1 ATP synthase subunit epsilon [Mesonia profundi]MDQ7918021.1 F0F1 ATP synthase subunit epsilon [Mesonia profundi]
MHLEIITPEKVLLSAEVESVAVPGVDGEFQMLSNHEAIVSVLIKGEVKIGGNVSLTEEVKNDFTTGEDGRLEYHIKGGVLEFKNNKAIVLAD